MPRTITRRRADIDTPRRGRHVEATEPDDDYAEGREEEETPRRGRTSSRPARSRRDDDEDERPSRSARAKSKRSKDRSERAERPAKHRESKGWSGYREQKAKTSSYNSEDELRVPEKKTLTLKFLEPYPFFTYREHWVSGRGKGQKNSFVCGEDDCPLCDVGHDEYRVIALFNVVDLADGVNKYLLAGPNLTDAIEEQADSSELELDDMDDYDEDNPAPVINQPGLYFAISKKKGSNNFFSHTVNPVWEERLKSDPLTDEELDEAAENLFDYSVIFIDKKSALRDVADEYLDASD